ncbi:uncharacterized protein LOC141631395 [Silene latifolia]|uniref:uncharacterized protein LOC141631395 n=1 Tax=Silene latifolia TaxID=37657 RepID=UPI003D76D2BC
MRHAKTDSNATTLTEFSQSTPSRSPPHRSGDRAIYYVQSPPRDSVSSHNSQKTINFVDSTPAITRHHAQHQYHHRLHPFDVFEEDGLLTGEDDEHQNQGISRRWCFFIWFVVGFFALFSFISLVLWGVSRNQPPAIAIKSIKFDEFDIQAGLDTTGVPTAMATLNATVKLTYTNTGTFFGVHVTSTPLQLFFEMLVLASGSMNEFYEKSKSQRQIQVQLTGDKVPLYGVASRISYNNMGAPTSPVNMTLSFRVRSRGYVLGKMVKPKFYKTIKCHVIMNSTKMNVAMSLKKNCTYT